MEKKYKYYGIKLTPNVFKELLIQFFDGIQFKRDVAISKIIKYHQENGGIVKDVSGVAVFKKATMKMRNTGLENIGYGVWVLNYKKNDVSLDVAEIEKPNISIEPDKNIGTGSNAVYMYYFDTYRVFAESRGEKNWQCKIGRTDSEPLQRIFNQSGTSFPELPHVALVIHCDRSQQLETTLHSILKLRNRRIKTAPGNEWFYTSPSEIENIYNSIYAQ